MAVRNPTVTDVLGDGSVIQFLYTGLLNGDTGAPIDAKNWGGHVDRSIEITAVAFGAGGTVVWEGSNEGTTFTTLRDPASAALTFSAAGFKEVLEISQLQRPNVTAGDGTTNISVSVIARRANPMRT